MPPKCKFWRSVPGDAHIECTRHWKLQETPKNLIEAIHNLPNHAGWYPYCFNDCFVCGWCPENEMPKTN